MPERPTHLAAIALGSNLSSHFGAPDSNLREAIARIDPLGRITAVSSFYITEPVGYTGQPDFTNAALLLKTALKPKSLLHALLAIERDMGRDRSAAVPAKGPRIVDLDLLLLDDLILDTPELTLPHPELTRRRFVLEPLAEIAPSLIHPLTRTTINQLLQAIS